MIFTANENISVGSLSSSSSVTNVMLVILLEIMRNHGSTTSVHIQVDHLLGQIVDDANLILRKTAQRRFSQISISRNRDSLLGLICKDFSKSQNEFSLAELSNIKS